MKNLFKMLGVILALCIVFTACDVSASGDNFTFSARVSSGEVKSGESFEITVTTENTSGAEYLYRGSSRIVGATAYLVSDADGGKITVNPTAVPITNDYRETVIEAGEKIVFTWTFGEYTTVPSGDYDLHLEFEGEKQVIPSFVTVK